MSCVRPCPWLRLCDPMACDVLLVYSHLWYCNIVTLHLRFFSFRCAGLCWKTDCQCMCASPRTKRPQQEQNECADERACPRSGPPSTVRTYRCLRQEGDYVTTPTERAGLVSSPRAWLMTVAGKKCFLVINLILPFVKNLSNFHVFFIFRNCVRMLEWEALWDQGLH